jgi:hypothetical protein
MARPVFPVTSLISGRDPGSCTLPETDIVVSVLWHNKLLAIAVSTSAACSVHHYSSDMHYSTISDSNNCDRHSCSRRQTVLAPFYFNCAVYLAATGFCRLEKRTPPQSSPDGSASKSGRKTGIGQFGSQSPWASVLVSAAIQNDIKDFPPPDGSAQNRNGTVRTTAIARSFRAKYKPVDGYRRPVL